MGSLNVALDKLFDEWKSTYDSSFVADGLMLKCDDTIDVENLWLQSNRRIAFLLKDQNQGTGTHWDDDARLWLRIDSRTQQLERRIFHNIANLFYGLSNASAEDYAQFWYGELDFDKVRSHFDHYPFAYIECKKTPGGPNLKDSELQTYLQRDRRFLIRELEILNPNIIVCCSGKIFGFIIDIFGESNLREYGINGNLRYSAERHTVIMYCEHPAKRFMNAGGWYDITMDLFRNFLKTEDGCNFING